MAEAAAKTKAPSNVSQISDKDMQTFIDVLNTLALGPVYTSRTTGAPQRLITMGGGTSGATQRAQIVSPESGGAERFVARHMATAVPGYTNAPEGELTAGAAKPGIGLGDLVDILNTLNVKSDKGVPRSASMSDPSNPSLYPYTALAFGKTPAEKSESLNDQISKVMQSLLWLRGSGGGSSSK